MGLFDKALKKGLGKVVGDAVGDVVKSLGDALDIDTINKPAQTQTQPQQNYQQPVYAAAPVQVNIRAEMPGILAQEFAAYAAAPNVSAVTWGVTSGPCKPFDYCLCANGRVVAAIMLTDHNRDRNSAYLNAKAACKAAGVPFINFYTHMPNERSYVVNRIKSFLS